MSFRPLIFAYLTDSSQMDACLRQHELMGLRKLLLPTETFVVSVTYFATNNSAGNSHFLSNYFSAKIFYLRYHSKKTFTQVEF
jgi:hypothetical protein